MFWNLVRYEFKNVNKWYLALYGAVLAISVLIGAFISSLSQNYNPNNAAYFIFFLILVFGGLSVTLWIATIFLIIRRFKGSVYDRQGYLTLTLPVSAPNHHRKTFRWSCLVHLKLYRLYLECTDYLLLNTDRKRLHLPL